MTCTFEEAMERRMRTSRNEATREVLALVESEDMYIGDAVSLVIESMPRQKTAQLRRWNDSWEGWCEWLEWDDRGWEIRAISSGIVGILAPLGSDWGNGSGKKRPSDDAVAAVIDASSVKYLGLTHFGGTRQKQMQFLYKIR